jgi:LPXTG-motif cell wall-anchored protein
MKNKKTYIIIGAIAVIGIGLFLWKRRKNGVEKRISESSDDLSSDKKEVQQGESEIKPKPVVIRQDIKNKIKVIPTLIQPKLKPNTYRMGYISFRPNGFHAVMLDNRPPQGTIRANDNVNITGTSFDGKYKVSSVWIDGSNRVGAIYVPIKYTPTGREDRTFERIGLIEIV